MCRIKNLKQKIILIAVCLTAVFVGWFLKVPCIWKFLTGFPCPGCGMTRACVSALKMDFVSAFSYHKMFWSLPLLFVYFMADGKLFKGKNADRIVLLAIAFGFVINWIYNIVKCL